MLSLFKPTSKFRVTKKRPEWPPLQPPCIALTLPVELWMTIFNSLGSRADNPTGLFLYPLLFINHFFKDAVESILYKDLYCTPSADPSRYPVRLGLLEHLGSCSRVAVHVRTLTVGYTEERVFPYGQASSMSHQYWRQVRRALLRVVRLQHLNIGCSPSSAEEWSRESLFSGCKFELIGLKLSGSGILNQSELTEEVAHNTGS